MVLSEDAFGVVIVLGRSVPPFARKGERGANGIYLRAGVSAVLSPAAKEFSPTRFPSDQLAWGAWRNGREEVITSEYCR